MPSTIPIGFCRAGVLPALPGRLPAAQDLRPPDLISSTNHVQLIADKQLAPIAGAKQAATRSQRLRVVALRRSKAVTPDQMEVLEILGKDNQSGHRTPIRVSKQRDFQSGLDVDEKGGGWQGGSKMRNLQEIRGSKWSNPVHLIAFWSESCEFGAFEFILIESVLESGPKRPHERANRINRRASIAASASPRAWRGR